MIVEINLWVLRVIENILTINTNAIIKRKIYTRKTNKKLKINLKHSKKN